MDAVRSTYGYVEARQEDGGGVVGGARVAGRRWPGRPPSPLCLLFSILRHSVLRHPVRSRTCPRSDEGERDMCQML